MNEVTELYENAEVKKQIPKICSSNKLYCKACKAYIEDVIPCCKKAEYPKFTAEKQIELIKFLMEQEDFSWTITQQGKNTEYIFDVGYEYSSGDFKEFAEALAGIVNNLWQDLTIKEKQQVKEILE